MPQAQVQWVLTLTGDPGLARSMDRWLRTSVWAAVEGIIPLSEKPQ
jgi:hypothetical protein